MRKVVAFIVLFAFLLTLTGNAAEVWIGGTFRTWTSASGKHKTEAKLVDVSEDGKTITLLKKDDKKIDVELAQLSKEDQEVVQKRRVNLIGVKDGQIITLFLKRYDFDSHKADQTLSGSRIGGTVVCLKSKEGTLFALSFDALTKTSQDSVRKRLQDEKVAAENREKERLARVREQQERERKEHEESGGFKNIFDAVAKGTVRNVEYFIKKGSNVNANKDKEEGSTPLHLAAMRRGDRDTDIEIVKYLISQGANVNATDKVMATPLHCAAFVIAVVDAEISIFKFLIASGANVNAKSDEGATPLAVAIAANHTALLIGEVPQHGRSIKAVKLLIEKGADVNAKGYGDNTPLHVAAGSEADIEVFKVLVAAGAKVDHRNKDGQTPLALAKEQNHTEAVRYLGPITPNLAEREQRQSFTPSTPSSGGNNSQQGVVVLEFPKQKQALPCMPCNGKGTVTCRDCRGTGNKVCGHCGGTGQGYSNRSGNRSYACFFCGGAGRVRCGTLSTCRDCNGNGYKVVTLD